MDLMHDPRKSLNFNFWFSFIWPAILVLDAIIIYGCYRFWHHVGQMVEQAARHICN